MKRVSIQPTERTDFDFILVHFSSRGRTLYNLLIFICFFNNNKHVMCVCVWGVFELEGPIFGQSTKCKQNCSVWWLQLDSTSWNVVNIGADALRVIDEIERLEDSVRKRRGRRLHVDRTMNGVNEENDAHHRLRRGSATLAAITATTARRIAPVQHGRCRMIR